MAMLTDFYRGWMIEVSGTSSGFQSVFCSPRGRRFSDRLLYPCQFDAWKAASQLIDRALACYTLKQAIRDIYESGQLEFEEWQLLQCSLAQTLESILVSDRQPQ